LPLAAWIVIGLALGAFAGLLLPASGTAAWSDAVVAGADVVARLWLAALQMTILPLVFALLSTTFVRSAGLAGSGSAARRTLVTILALYLLAIAVGLVFTPILLGLSPVTPAIASAMRSAGGAPVAVAHLQASEMILGVVPSNVVSAAASGSLLPVVANAARSEA
jgi:Na+/H+-dicarboxylate symporter